MRLAELVEFRRRMVILKGPPQQRQPFLIQQAVIGLLRIVPPASLQVRRSQQALLHQRFRVQKPGVPREGRGRLIGRISKARGRDGQQLPVALARRVQKIDKVPGSPAQIANAVGRGQ